MVNIDVIHIIFTAIVFVLVVPGAFFTVPVGNKWVALGIHGLLFVFIDFMFNTFVWRQLERIKLNDITSTIKTFN